MNVRALESTGAGRLTARQKVGEVELEQIDVTPRPVSPGGVVTITVGLVERATFVGPFDPDLCNPPGIVETTGLATRVTAAPEWRPADDELVCVPVFNTTEGRASVDFQFPAPELEGEFAVQVSIELPGSGQGPESAAERVVVERDSKAGCRSNLDCPGQQVCEGGQCVDPGGQNGDGNIIENASTLIALIVVMLILLVVVG